MSLDLLINIYSLPGGKLKNLTLPTKCSPPLSCCNRPFHGLQPFWRQQAVKKTAH